MAMVKQGDNNQNQEEKVVYVKAKDEDSEKKNKRRKIIALILGLFVVVDIILGIIFIPKIIKNLNKQSNTPSSYVMDKHTETRYNNLLSYVNQQRQDGGYSSDMTSIVALSFSKPNLQISYKNDAKPGYLSVNMDDCADFSEALNSFNNGIPTPGKYVYEVRDEEFYTSKNININSSLIQGHISSFGTKIYLSCTYLYNDTTIASITHQDFNDEGIYTPYKVTEQENKILFDLYYFILNK